MKPCILFDIDFTLIDTNKLHTRIKRYLFNLKNAPFVWNNIAAVRHVATYTHIKDLNPTRFERTLFDPLYYTQAVYPDVEASLMTLKQFARLGIWSEASPRLQYIKLFFSRLYNFFDPNLISITPSKCALLPLLAQRFGPNLYIIDDRPDMLKTARNYNIHTVLIDRNKKYVYSPDFNYITTLLEITQIFKLR